MYLDKLYTKLYSDGNFKGIEKLFSEIRAFAMSKLNDEALKAKIKLAKRGKLNPMSSDTNFLVNDYVNALKTGNKIGEEYNDRILKGMHDPDIDPSTILDTRFRTEKYRRNLADKKSELGIE